MVVVRVGSERVLLVRDNLWYVSKFYSVRDFIDGSPSVIRVGIIGRIGGSGDQSVNLQVFRNVTPLELFFMGKTTFARVLERKVGVW